MVFGMITCSWKDEVKSFNNCHSALDAESKKKKKYFDEKHSSIMHRKFL
jgi:hypothetical protein